MVFKSWPRTASFCGVCAVVLVILYFISDTDSISIGGFSKASVQLSKPLIKTRYSAYDKLNAFIKSKKNDRDLEDDPELLEKNGYNYHKSGYGIVFSATLQTLPFIYVSISIMQYLNITQYPIEIYLNELDGTNEKHIMSVCNSYATEFNNNNLRINCKFCHHHPFSILSYKALYLLDSSFQHVLYLDFYNIMIQNPQILFDSDQYKTNFAIYWADGCYKATQLVMDTIYYHNMLNLVIECDDSNKYPHKDCFKLMWINKNKSFYFIEIQPQYIGIMMNSTFKSNGLFNFWLNDRTLCDEGKRNNNPMFIHQEKLIEPIDDRLWNYYQETKNQTCTELLSETESDSGTKYKIDTIKDNKVNADLVAELEPKWIDFWNKAKSIIL